MTDPARERRSVGAVLLATRSVAVVGISDHPTRPSFGVAAYLVDRTDYDVYLVNPHITEVLGRPVYPALDRLPVVPDLVDTFRRSSALGEVADAAIEVGARVLWFQLGLRDEQAADRARRAGLEVVMDRCLRTEHTRLVGAKPYLRGKRAPGISGVHRRTSRRDH